MNSNNGPRSWQGAEGVWEAECDRSDGRGKISETIGQALLGVPTLLTVQEEQVQDFCLCS